MQPARRDHAEDRRGGLGVSVAAVKHPALTTDDDLSQRAFCSCVVERQVTVVEDASKLGLLVRRVAERLGRQVATGRDGSRRVRPGEEVVDEWTDVRIAERLALGGRCALHDVVRGVDRADPQQAL